MTIPYGPYALYLSNSTCGIRGYWHWYLRLTTHWFIINSEHVILIWKEIVIQTSRIFPGDGMPGFSFRSANSRLLTTKLFEKFWSGIASLSIFSEISGTFQIRGKMPKIEFSAGVLKLSSHLSSIGVSAHSLYNYSSN